MPKFRGRKKPYTAIGIGRIPCARCGQPSTYQWCCCANDGNQMGFCTDCDVAMNAMVLTFVGFPNAADLMKWYMEKIGYDGPVPEIRLLVDGKLGVLAPRDDHHHVDVCRSGSDRHSRTGS